MKSLSRNLMLSVIALSTFTLQGAKADMIDLYMMGVLPSIVSRTPPVADAGGDQNKSICDIIALDGNSSKDPDGKIVKYEWKAEDNTILGTDPILSIPITSDRKIGEQNITLTVTDDDNLSSSDSIKLTINGTDSDYDFSYIIKDPYAGDAEDYINYKSDVKLTTERDWKYWYPTLSPGAMDMYFSFNGDIQIVNLTARLTVFKFSPTNYGEAYLYAKNDDNAPEWTELDHVVVPASGSWAGGGTIGFVQDDLLGSSEFWVRTKLTSHGMSNLAQFLRYQTGTDTMTFKLNVCHDGVDPQ